MITREAKQAKIHQFAARVEAAQALIIAENTGLSAAQLTALRIKLQDCDGRAQVVKNTLARLVLKDGPFKAVSDKLSGPLIYGVGADPAALAKIFVDVAKDNQALVIRGGALADGDGLDAAAVVSLSKLPGRQELLGILAATMQAPVTSFVRALNDAPARLVRALAAIRDKKQAAD